MDKPAPIISARYYRLHHKSHIVGFMRVLRSGEEEYLPMTGYSWTQKKLCYDASIQLSTPPVGIHLLPRLQK